MAKDRRANQLHTMAIGLTGACGLQAYGCGRMIPKAANREVIADAANSIMPRAAQCMPGTAANRADVRITCAIDTTPRCFAANRETDLSDADHDAHSTAANSCTSLATRNTSSTSTTNHQHGARSTARGNGPGADLLAGHRSDAGYTGGEDTG